jgi:acyl-CoA dehydrogenase
LQASPARDRLTAGIFVSPAPDDITGRIEHAFELVPQAESIEARIKAAIKDGAIKVTDERSARTEALNAGIVSAEDMQLLEAWDRAVRAAIDVDDFAPEALAPLRHAARG